jgi:hypothetical protein
MQTIEKHMKNILPLFVLLSGFIGGHIISSPALANPIIISDWKKLEQANYSIRYPANWDVLQNDRSEPGARIAYPFSILSPLASSDDKFRENVNLVIEDLNGQKIDLNTYASMSIGQLKSQMKNCKIVENKRVDSSSRKYYKVIFTWDYETLPLKVEQYYWVIGTKAYIVTFSSEQSQFASVRDVGEKILNTFTLK